jgi:hypothetical protein
MNRRRKNKKGYKFEACIPLFFAAEFFGVADGNRTYDNRNQSDAKKSGTH